MEALCLDIMNSDWRGYQGGEPERDRLLEPAWIEQVMQRWSIHLTTPLDTEAVTTLQNLRSSMKRIVFALEEHQTPPAEDIVSLNSYLRLTPTFLSLLQEDEIYRVEEIPEHQDWRWLLREAAASFANLLARPHPARLKQCKNPDCRWAYYDESRQKHQVWCNETCATLMRVRRFRIQHQKT